MDGIKTKRVPEIELMKAIAIIGMVFVHILEGSLEYFENAWEFPGKIPYTAIEFLGGIPAAGVFTFAMGWGAAHSDRSTVKTYLKRAWQIGLLLFYVNIVYAILPGILDPDHFTPLKDHPWAIIGFNIYSFAALCMLYFALMKKLQDKPAARAGISIGIVAAIMLVEIFVDHETYTGNEWIASLIGAVVRQNHYSWFPIVPWGIFPIMGYGAGLLYRRWDNRVKFMSLAMVTGAALVTVSEIATRMKGLPRGAANPGWVIDEADYYCLSPWSVVCAVGIICLETALAFGIMSLADGKLHPVLANMSRHVMAMFIVHWIFVSPLFLYLIHVTNVWYNVLIGLGTLIATYVVVELWYHFRSSRAAS